MIFIVSNEKCTMQKTSGKSRITNSKQGKIQEL